MIKYIRDLSRIEMSDYEGHSDYIHVKTVLKYFKAVRNDNIMEMTEGCAGHWCLSSDASEDMVNDVNAYYIIDNTLANLLSYFPDTILYTNLELDMRLWGVHHEHGGLTEDKEYTALTLTPIPCEKVNDPIDGFEVYEGYRYFANAANKYI